MHGTHDAVDSKVHNAEVIDGGSQRRGRRSECLDGSNDGVRALRHSTGRAHEDNRDDGDEVAEELHGDAGTQGGGAVERGERLLKSLSRSESNGERQCAAEGSYTYNLSSDSSFLDWGSALSKKAGRVTYMSQSSE